MEAVLSCTPSDMMSDHSPAPTQAARSDASVFPPAPCGIFRRSNPAQARPIPAPPVSPAPPELLVAPDPLQSALDGLSEQLAKRIDAVAELIRDQQQAATYSACQQPTYSAGSELQPPLSCTSTPSSCHQLRIIDTNKLSMQPCRTASSVERAALSNVVPVVEVERAALLKELSMQAMHTQTSASEPGYGTVQPPWDSSILSHLSRRSKTSAAARKQADKRRQANKSAWEQRLDYASLFVIFLNTAWLGFEAEARMKSAVAGEPVGSWVLYVNAIFAAVFSVELVCKIYLLRSDFWKKDRTWNLFDTALVMSSLADVLLDFVNAGFMRTLRILRAVRAARMMRVVGYVQHLRLMVASMATSFPTLVWACVLLALLLFLCALVLIIGVEAHIRSGSADLILLDRFGSLGTTTITLFMSISGGLDWDVCMEALQRVHVIYAPFFAIWVGFASFSVVGVLTAVIIEASSSILQIDKDLVIERVMREDVTKKGYLMQLFRDIDTEKDGLVNEGELKEALRKEETIALLRSLELDVSRTHEIFHFLDVDQNGEVDIDEFVDGLMKCRGITIIAAENQRLSSNLSESISVLRQDIMASLGSEQKTLPSVSPSDPWEKTGTV